MQSTSLPTERNTFLPNNRIVRHILFWIWIYLIDVFVFGMGYENIPLFLKLALLEMPGQLFFAYVVMYWVVPGYLADKHQLKWISITAIAFIICGLIGQYLFIVFDAYTTEVSLFDVPKIFLRAFYSFLKACLAVLVKLGAMWYTTEKKVASLERARLESELKMLKEQVNPHFMFNTLNSLYGLIAKNAEQAQACVIKLSGILQFMLHESNHAVIPLKRELHCVRDYIDLEKIRYADKLEISVDIEEDVNRLHISPLLLFPLVENSFKHGVAENLDFAWINLHCSTDHEFFTFKLENSKAPVNPITEYSGIGLANVKRRLELMYPDNYSLQIINGQDSYLLVLKINLSKMSTTEEKTYETEMSYR
jgi:two-component system, LytTR family, sensor kinase